MHSITKPQQQQINGSSSTNSRAWEVSADEAAAASAARGAAEDTPIVEACAIPFPSKDGQTVSDPEQEDEKNSECSPGEFHPYSILEPQVQNGESPISPEFSSSSRGYLGTLEMPNPFRKSSSDVDRIFNQMTKSEISTVENKKRIQQPQVTNTPNDCEQVVRRDGTRRSLVVDEHLENLNQLAVGFYQHRPMDIEIINDPLEESNPNPQQPDGSSRGATPVPSQIAVGSALPTLGEEPSWANRVTDSQNHQSPPWFQNLEDGKKTRLRETVLKYLDGTLGRELNEALWFNFGLPNHKTSQILAYIKLTREAVPVQRRSTQTQHQEDENSWVKLGGARPRRRRRVPKIAEDGQSFTTEVTKSRDPSPTQRSEVSMQDVRSVASTGPTGFAPIKNSIKAIKAEQLRESTAGRHMDRILVDLTEDNLESSANKLWALMHGSDNLVAKAAHLIVHSQGRPTLDKLTPPQAKQRAEAQGALIAQLIGRLAPKTGATSFENFVLNEFKTECKKVSPPPKFSVVSMIGEMHTPLGLVDDPFMHECTKLMLEPNRRSHVQAITMMLGRCTPDWKHKQRLVFPLGIYDELKLQSRQMGKPTYMGVKALAERTRPSWMDRQEDARMRRSKQRQGQNRVNNWHHRRQPHQNWANNARSNNQHRFVENAPSVASNGSRRSRRRTRRQNRSRNQSPHVRLPSPAMSCRTDATMPVTTPITPNVGPSPADVVPPRVSMMDVESGPRHSKPRGSAYSLVAALNKARSIRDRDSLRTPMFEPAPTPNCVCDLPRKSQFDDVLSIAAPLTDMEGTEMGSVAGSEMECCRNPCKECPCRPCNARESREEQKERSPKWNQVSGNNKRSRRYKKNKASGPEPKKKPSSKKGKKARGGKRGKRGGKRKNGVAARD